MKAGFLSATRNLFIMWRGRTSTVSVMLFFLLAPITSRAQRAENLEASITGALVAEGFNNVAVCAEENQLILTYENLIYRYEVTALKEVLRLVCEILEEDYELVIVIQRRKIPISAFNISSELYKSWLAGETEKGILRASIKTTLNTDNYWKKLENKQKTNNSDFIFEIVLHPQYKANFVGFVDPVDSQVNICPELKTTLLPGFSISGRVIFPIFNDLNSEGNYIRPGLSNINQFFRFPFNTFLSATLGYFTGHRYGIDIQIRKYFLNGNFFLGGKIGYTGYASFFSGVLYYTHLNAFTPFLETGYYYSRCDVQFKFTYGRSLYEDAGWRFDIKRYFGEVDIGFYYTQTDIDKNGGFNIRIPLFLSSYMKSGPVRIRPAGYFPWEYRARATRYGWTNYSTGLDIGSSIKKYLPGYLKSQFFE